MHVLFYQLDGSEQRSMQYTSPGRGYFAQDEEHNVDHVCNVGDVITFHVGHGVYRNYVVADCDGKVALLHQQ